MTCRGSLAWFGRQTHNEYYTQIPNIDPLNIDWNSFKEYVFNNLSLKCAKDVLRYSKRYVDILQYPKRASRIGMLPKDKKRLVMASLSNLSKYLGIYEYWRAIIKNHGLKWEKRSALETIIDILNTNLEDAKVWAKETIPKIPREYGSVLVFDALTGLRASEACNSCNLIADLADSGNLDQYFDPELSMLQHFRFKELFLRHNKNAYISFVSKELLNLVLEFKPRVTYGAMRHRLNRIGIPNKMKQLRKLHGTLLRNHLPKELIDLLHGRISESVFLRFYYKPFLQDIRDKTLTGIEPLQNELLELLS